jgi:hypothetical protein
MANWDLPSDSNGLQATLLKAAIGKDYEKALRHFGGRLDEIGMNMDHHFSKAFATWMQDNPTAAIAWLDAQLTGDRVVRRVFRTSGDHVETRLSGMVIARLMETDTRSAIRRYVALESDQKREVLFGLSHMVDILEPAAAAGLVAFMRGTLTDDEYQVYLNGRNAYSGMGYKFVQNDDFEGLGRFLDSIDALPAERRVFADGAAASVLYRLKGGEKGELERAAVDGLREWLARVAPDDMDRITGVALTRIHAKFQTTASLVESIHQETGGDEILIAYLGGVDKRKSEKEWERLAAKIEDDAKRDEILSGRKSK